MIDLHTHSTASDGMLSPRQLVHRAKEIGLNALALTDHDTVDGIDEAQEAALEVQLKFIPGVELSTKVDKGALHIVGLFIDPNNSQIREVLDKAVHHRRTRNEKIVRRLTELGLPMKIDEVRDLSKGGVMGRPHIAQLMVKKGYAKNFETAFKKFLARGQPAYFPKVRIDKKEAVAIIRSAGGVPVLAHPSQTYLKGAALDALVTELIGMGLCGIETRCSGYGHSDISQYARLAKKYNLVESGGSDFHGDIKPSIALGKGTGRLYVPDDLLPPIEKLAKTIAQSAGACGNRTHPARC